MRFLLRIFWPLVLLSIFTAVFLREIGTGLVMALQETSERWRTIKRTFHPSTER